MTALKILQALGGACSGIAGGFKQFNEESKIAAESRRKQEEARLQAQQQLSYQQPINIRLDGQQIADIDAQLCAHPGLYTAELLLTPQQTQQVIHGTIQQAYAGGNMRTIATLRNALIPAGLYINLFYLYQLHKRIFDDFIFAYNPAMAYAACTPPGGMFFIISADGFGFCYNIGLEKNITLQQYREDFKRYMATASAQELFKQAGLKFNKITCFNDTKNLIIYFK